MGISNLSIGLGLGIVLQLTSPQKNYVQPNILQRGIEKMNLSITHSRASSLDKLESTEKQESTQDLSRMRLLLRPTFWHFPKKDSYPIYIKKETRDFHPPSLFSLPQTIKA